jgi:hypothetical protein
MPPAPQGGVPVTKDPRSAPSTVQNAVRLMFGLVALSIISLIVVFADKNSLRDAIEDRNPSFDTSQVDSAVNTAVAVGAVIGIILMVLYVLLALQVRKGKNWARIVTWILAGLGVLSGLASLAQTQTAFQRITTLVGAAIDLAIIILLARANDYFRKPQYYYGPPR